jgi:hypothetical protein
LDQWVHLSRRSTATTIIPRISSTSLSKGVRRASVSLGTSRGSSRGSSSTTLLPPRVRVPRHVARLVVWLVVDYFDYAARPVTSPTPHVRVPRHVARLVTGLVVDYFAASPGASARRAAHHAARRRLLRLAQARCRLLRLRRASGCLGTSRGPSHGSSSTTSSPLRVRVPRHVVRLVTRLVVDYFDYAARLVTSPTPRVRVPRHVVRLVTRLVVDYFTLRRLVVDYCAYAACPGASAHRAARHAARRRLLCLHRASGCLSMSCGSSRGSSRRSSSTTSPAPHVRVPRHVARLVTGLVVDYFAYAARPGALARRAAHHAARRRLLRLA